MRFALLGAGVFALSMLVGSGQAGVPSGLPLPVLIGIAAAAGVAAWHARRSWWPLAALGAVAYVWLVMWPPLLVASYFAGRTLSRNHVAAYAAGCAGVCGVSALAGWWRGGAYELQSATLGNALFLALAVVALPLAVGLWARARHEVREAAKERAERLEREQVMRAEQARAQERARIAREMHDVVAHRVSLIVLHAGALEVRTADDETARTAAMIGGIGREALANLREVLGVLRSAPDESRHQPPPTLGDLDRLLDQSRALGIAVTRHDEGDPRPVESSVERTAYRVVQEALTNVHKHAADASTDVHIRYGLGELRIEIRNGAPGTSRAEEQQPGASRSTAAGVPGGEARGPGAELPGAGWGLVGLRERVELLGGTLRTSAQDGGGFLVSARIPA